LAVQVRILINCTSVTELRAGNMCTQPTADM